jgi:hypothetical protein
LTSQEEQFAKREWERVEQARSLIARENATTDFKASALGVREGSVAWEEYELVRKQYAHLYSGGNCWNDPEFRAAYLRDNPHCRSKTTRGTKGQKYIQRSRLNLNGANFGGLPLAT